MSGGILTHPQRITSGWWRLLGFCGMGTVTTCSGVLFLYHRNVWMTERVGSHQLQVSPPSRRTRQFVAGSGNHQGKVTLFQFHLPVLRGILFYGLVFARTILLAMYVVPIMCSVFLTYGLHVRSEVALFAKVRDTLSAMGPSYIKLGQWAATRPDIFPPLMCTSLEKLYDHTEPHLWSHTERMLRDAFHNLEEHPSCNENDVVKSRRNVLHYLEEIEKVPVNSGSIAQVHRAVLREEIDGIPKGTELAIKVLHPYVCETISADLFVMRCVVSLVTTLFRDAVYFDLKRALDEFSGMLCSQLDLQAECDNLRLFAFNFRAFPGVIFPKPLPTLSSVDVLVETFEEGRPLQEIYACDDYEGVAQRGCHMFLKMLFEDNFVHSDLHPGNVLLRTNPGAPLRLSPTILFPDGGERYPDGKPKLRYELVVLDAGLTTSLSQEERDNFISLFAAVACGDGNLGADLMVERLPPDIRARYSKVNREKFRADMNNIFNVVAPGESVGFTLRHVDMGCILCKIMNTLRENSTPIDGNFASLVLTVVVGEGLGRRLTPDFNLFAEAAPYLVGFLEDKELCFLAGKLRNTYGTGTLLRDSLSLAKLERTPTYVEIVLRKALKTVDNVLLWLTRKTLVASDMYGSQERAAC